MSSKLSSSSISSNISTKSFPVFFLKSSHFLSSSIIFDFVCFKLSPSYSSIYLLISILHFQFAIFHYLFSLHCNVVNILSLSDFDTIQLSGGSNLDSLCSFNANLQFLLRCMP